MTVKTVKLNKLLVFIAITELAGLFGFLLGGSPKQSYAALVKPPAAPPGWLFSVVWVALYLLIGTAAYLFSCSGPGSAKVLRLYWVQLLLNVLWSPFFWRLQFRVCAALIIAALLVLNGLIFWFGCRLNRLAALLFLPYLLWLCFALYLNIGFVLLN